MLIKLIELGYSLNTRGKYCLQYKVGKITEAVPGTVGIFCYDYSKENKDYLESFIREYTQFELIHIYEVEGIGEPRKRVRHSLIMDEEAIDQFYQKNILPQCWMVSRDEVVCYPAVKVLRKLKLEEIQC